MELTPEQQRQRESREGLIRELGRLGAKFTGNRCRCPFHDDKHASAGVYRTAGVWKFKCQGCDAHGDIFDMRARSDGRPMGEILKEAKGETESYFAPKPPPPPPKQYATLEALIADTQGVVDTYRYTNPITRALELIVLRQELPDGKSFKQAHQTAAGKFVKTKPEGKLPIYNRTRVSKAQEVVVVEGEKCVHALADIGIVATTAAGGAGKASYADWSPLIGKTVYLWPDNDAPDPKTKTVKGITHMDDVQRELASLDPAPTVKRIDISELDLPVKGDVVDYLEMNEGTKEDKKIAVELVLGNALGTGGAAMLAKRFELITSGQYRSIEWPWARLSRQGNCILPGTITTICADPGAGKSFVNIQVFFSWLIQGLKVAVFELEGKKDYYLHRLLAQIEGDSRLADTAYIEANPTLAREAIARNADLLDSFERCLFASPDKPPTLPYLAEWTIEKLEQGHRIVGIDPITAAEQSDRPWIADQKFIFTIKPVLERTGGSLILMTHPRTSSGKRPNTQMSNMAGGAAYPRFSDSALWIETHPNLRKANVSGHTGVYAMKFNRSVQIRKARNGPGAGRELAYHFNPDNVMFEELGLVIPEESESSVSSYTES